MAECAESGGLGAAHLPALQREEREDPRCWNFLGLRQEGLAGAGLSGAGEARCGARTSAGGTEGS